MIYLAILIAVVLAVWYYKNTSIEISKKLKFLLGFLRFLSVFICLFLLFNPVYSYVKKFVKKPVSVILTDSSNSMLLTQSNQKSKQFYYNNWQNAVYQQYKNAGYEVKSFEFASDINGVKESTNLNKTLLSLKKQNILTENSEIALLSDGWYDDSNYSFLQNFSYKINTFGIKQFEQKPDIELIELQTNTNAFIDEETPIVVKAKNSNVKGKSILKIYTNNKVVIEKEIDLKSGEIKSYEFYYLFKNYGAKIIKAEIVNGFDEVLTNNELAKGISVKKGKNKLLIITDALNWDTAFLAKSINKNPHWNSITAFKMGKKLLLNNKQVTMQQLVKQTSVIALFNSGTLSFDEKQKQILSNMAKLNKGFMVFGKPIDFDFLGVEANYIEQSFEGELVFTAEANNYATFTESEIVKAQLPPVSYNYVKAKAGAQILATFNNPQNSEAIIFYDKQGCKNLFFAFNGLWKVQLWEQKLDVFFENAVQWLASLATEKIDLKTDKTIYTVGQTANVKLKLFDETFKFKQGAKVKLVIEHNNKKQNKYFVPKAFSYEYDIENLKTGKYKLTAIDEDNKQYKTKEFEVVSEGTENLQKDVNYLMLKHIAKLTGGKFFEENKKFVAKKQNALQINKNVNIPLYRKWWVWLTFVLSFCIELLIRKQKGLL